MNATGSHHADSRAAPWQVWVDTGGTFTDCIAIDPSGRSRRAKVLSHSALRGRVVRQHESRTIEVHQHWDACQGLLDGFGFRMLGAASSESPLIRVAHHDVGASMLVLDRDLPGEMAAHDAFELQSDEPAPILAARLATRTPAGRPLPPMRFRLATTRGTNAMLERRGAEVALFITRGFGDLLAIGDQHRPELFALDIIKPLPLNAHVIEVDERLDSAGRELVPLDQESLAREARKLVRLGIRIAAVALLHSFNNQGHEQTAARILREAGFRHVSCSAALAPMIRILPRAQTAVVNAYLAPVIDAHLGAVAAHLGGSAAVAGRDSSLHVMTSAGGLVQAVNYTARDSLLSGPAGGVLGAAAAARDSGFHRIIGFDMGGTSTDVARSDGELDYRFEQVIGDVRLMAPALVIETVAAGGGSVCDVLDGQLVVGPRSAGASPGPACYGAGGPLTLTDVNLLLGRLQPDQFDIPLDRAAAVSAMQGLVDRLHVDLNRNLQAEELAEGFLAIANQRMASAIEMVSIRQGYDPAHDALVSFGGAGGQHACAVAGWLGMRTVIMPADASLLSAKGLGAAVLERVVQIQVLRPLVESHAGLPGQLLRSALAAATELESEGVAKESLVIRRVILNLRLTGQNATLALEFGPFALGRDLTLPSPDGLMEVFRSRYQRIYGHLPSIAESRPVEIESARIVVSESRDQALAKVADREPVAAAPIHRVQAWIEGGWRDVPLFDRDAMAPGSRMEGPAIIAGGRTSFILESGWQGAVDAAGAVIARRVGPAAPGRVGRAGAAHELDLFCNRLGAIAEEMGHVLQRTSLSTNVKERLDFSCALLNAAGELVVNAPHIPVHLGAMGVCVREAARRIAMRPGDVIITNHPACGGSHLPDVTIITPVFDDGQGLLGYAASRAHHAEIGGTRPGSMPPAATTLAEEGIVIPPLRLVREGVSQFDDIERLLAAGPHPTRHVEDNLADFRAAVAANRRGADGLRALAAEYGPDRFAILTGLIMDRANELARTAYRALQRSRYEAMEHLDDGSPIRVAIDVHEGSMRIDFTGSAPVHPGNLNATPAIVRSAVMYVLRLMIGQSLPLNEGIMRGVDIVLPAGMLNPPFTDDPAASPAVVGGNTETSQRVVDTLIKAFGLAACSQGTMNNVLFGNARFSYYETVCGGCGATSERAGADAVHSHMTNTRITDPEIIEHRYPVRVERFAIRSRSGGSGGAGRNRGGHGVIRELAFLEPMSLSVLTQHRGQGPYGAEGGSPGAPGSQTLFRSNGQIVHLGSIDGAEVAAGDRLILQTPGGGGWGSDRA